MRLSLCAHPCLHPQGYGTYITVMYVIVALVFSSCGLAAWLALKLKQDGGEATGWAAWWAAHEHGTEGLDRGCPLRALGRAGDKREWRASVSLDGG